MIMESHHNHHPPLTIIITEGIKAKIQSNFLRTAQHLQESGSVFWGFWVSLYDISALDITTFLFVQFCWDYEITNFGCFRLWQCTTVRSVNVTRICLNPVLQPKSTCKYGVHLLKPTSLALICFTEETWEVSTEEHASL